MISTKQQVFGIALNFEKVWLFSSIKYFFKENEYLLATIILVFTFLLPIIKYFELLNRFFGWVSFGEKTKHYLSLSDKWSMLDVFIVALLIMNFKMDSSIIVMKIRIGTTFLAASIILRMIASNLLKIEKTA